MFISESIKTEIVTITPEQANRLLELNKRNRSVSPKNLEKLEAVMLRGEWRLNGEAIKVSSNGRILDGQHRLMASAKTGITFQTLVVYGLPDETQETMDNGKPRRLSDILALRGYTNTYNLAAILTALIRYDIYGARQAFTFGGGSKPVTNQQALLRLDQDPKIEGLYKKIQPVTRIGLPAKISGTLFYKLSEIDENDAKFFFDRLSDGIDLDERSPIRALRETLIRLKNDRGKQNSVFLAALAIKSWNKFRDGEEVFQLKFRTGGANPENFPEPK